MWFLCICFPSAKSLSPCAQLGGYFTLTFFCDATSSLSRSRFPFLDAHHRNVSMDAKPFINICCAGDSVTILDEWAKLVHAKPLNLSNLGLCYAPLAQPDICLCFHLSFLPFFLVSDWIIHNDKIVSPESDRILHAMMLITKCAPVRSWRYDSCWVLFLRVLLQRGIYFNQANLHCDIVWNRLDSFP